ncbi:MAG TPA: TonB-dependent receptor [Saprospiraceae bacterium]|nr:TonB-dependent receptor [Saprospiraceae bacterium]HRG21622.1 TonB-dependent receptor [Saprospiraceae bacterium]
MRYDKIVFCLFLLCPFFLSSQSIIKGHVDDKSTALPLIGATVVCDQQGTITDENGDFQIVTSLPCRLTISYVGYKSITQMVESASTTLFFEMQELSEVLDLTTVTATKFEQRLSESTVAVEVIKPNLLRSTNTIKSDDILNKLPGVQVVGGQANIRGGSGFSYGAGSRVMVLLDDMPALQVDAGYANWGDMPVEAIAQVEVVKGASSALYGSSALNGIINFRRLQAGVKPETNAFVSLTHYLSPKEEKYKWWGDSIFPYRFNFGMAHSQKIKNTDLTIHGYFGKLESYAKETYETRGRLGFNVKHKMGERSYLGVNALLNVLESSDFFIWRNALRGIYEPFTGTVSSGNRIRMSVDPYFIHYHKNGAKHRLNTRYFYTNNDNNNNQQNQSSTYYAEYQFSHEYAPWELQYSAGAVLSLTDSKAQLFGDSSFLYTNSAAYLQLDKKFGQRLTMSAGARYEFNRQNSPQEFQGFMIPGGKVEDSQIISRLGLNYKLMEYSSLRISWGQGYRYPTVTERFISTQFGGFTIFPNPVLSPEYGWSAEIGLKQGFKLASFKGYLDLSAFTQEYEDMIEFTFLENPYGFKPINIGNTRISGYEAGLTGQFDVFSVPVTTIIGYTYINPVYKNFDQRPEIKDNISTTQNVLKYRSKHSAKADLEASYKNFKLGYAIQYYSHVINIDSRFEAPIAEVDLFSIKAYRDRDNDGSVFMDARLSYTLNKYTLGFLINNLTNAAYTTRPGLLEAPRNVSVRLDVAL